MNAVIPPLCIVAASFLSVAVLSGCGGNPNSGCNGHTGHNGATEVIPVPIRNWPDQRWTGGDGEVDDLNHLSIDGKLVDVWSAGGGASPSDRTQIDIGLRDHTRDELKSWKVRITSPTLWPGFTTETIRLADVRFFGHPDYQNGVAVFYEGHDFRKLPEPGAPRCLNIGKHTVTVEILDELDQVKGQATLHFNVVGVSGVR